METWLWQVVAVLMALRLAAQLVLDILNRGAVRAAAGAVPEAFRETVDAETYAKGVAYTLAKIRLGMIETVYDALILAVVIFGGLLPVMWGGLTGVLGDGIWGGALSLFLVVTALGLPGLPFEWYYQFRLEERFGFNKSSLGLWLMDKVKGLLVGMVLSVPLLAAVLWIVELTPLWWVWAFVLFFVFQMVMIVVYPMFIMPLFNKFEPMAEGSLRERLMALGARTGFTAKTILVMDGSRRSAHSNAFFTGFGRFRRIVLYDTLVEQLGERELEAVLAHEIGHYKLGHIPRLMAFSGLSLLVSFWVLGWLAQQQWFAVGFGFEADAGMGPVLLLFGVLSGLLTFWSTPLTNVLSRRHEYQADAFARAAMGGDGAPLVNALRRLSEKNLSNLTPHGLYSAFYYSHPTLLERERALAVVD